MVMTSLGAPARLVAAASLALLALFGAGPAGAQDFPVHPKAITFPAAGTSHDFVKSAAVSDGFVAAWNRVTGGKTSVVIRRFAADGTQVGDLAVAEDGALAGSLVEGRPEVVNLGGDRIGVVWMGAGPALKGAVYDAATGALSAPVVYFSTGTLANVPHDLALLKNGSVAIMTRRAVSGGEDTTLFFVDQTMAQVGGSHVVEHDVSGYSKSGIYDHTVVRVGSNVAVIYRAVNERLRMNIYSPAGVLLLDSKFVEEAGRPWNEVEFRRFTIKTDNLPGGGFLVAWTNTRPDDIETRFTYVQTYDKDGNVRRSARTYGPLRSYTLQPDVFVTEKGYGVGWLQTSGAAGLVTHQVQFFGSDRDLVTEYYGAHGPSGIATLGEASNFVRLPNGDFVRLFAADGRIYGDRIPNPKIGKDTSVDGLEGSPDSDVILQRRSQGDISGGDGDDIIENGWYPSLIRAGKGDDVIVARSSGPFSPAKISGGAGDDVFRIAPGANVEILDFKAGDRLDLSMFYYVDWKDALRTATKVGKDVIFEFVDQTQAGSGVAKVKLIGVRRKELTADNIIY